MITISAFNTRKILSFFCSILINFTFQDSGGFASEFMLSNGLVGSRKINGWAFYMHFYLKL